MMQLMRSAQAMRGAVLRPAAPVCPAPLPFVLHNHHSSIATSPAPPAAPRSLATQAAAVEGYEAPPRSYAQYAVYKARAHRVLECERHTHTLL